MLNNEETKVANIVNILKMNGEDYREVFILKDLLERICASNSIFQNNLNFLFNQEDSINNFFKRNIICFHKVKGYDLDDFFIEIAKVKKIDINNCDIYTIFEKSIDELLREESNINPLNYVQLIGYKKDGIKSESICYGYDTRSNKLNLKNFSCQLINTRNFELLRLIVGDSVLNYLFKYTSIFVFEEKMQNYFQITGFNLKDKLMKLLDVAKMKYNNSLMSSNLYTKSYKSGKEVGRKNSIPNPGFVVERTKIYYCPNFNRKLGFHKNSLRNTVNKAEDSVTYLFKRIFMGGSEILPKNKGNDEQNVEDYIKANIALILDKIKKYDFPRNLYRCCPNKIPNWKTKKQEVLEQIENSDIKGLNENLLLLINDKNTVSYNDVYTFVSSFLAEVLPKNFVGWDNFEIILEKLKVFLRMNRYETLNKISLFNLKEFSFENMEVFNHMRMKDKHFKTIGIKLKNYIMKSIIHWVFDFLIVQIIRSHFYVTEKQGDHYKTFFYHKKDWDLVIKINQKKLETQFKPIDIKDAKKELEHNDLAFGKLRLMPKSSSCRPIVSYRRKTHKSKQLLKNLFFETQKVFKHLSNKMQANSDNCVVFDYKTIIKRLLYYKDMLGSELEDLSYHTLDIEACYDNIDIDKLINFLDNDDIISENFVSNVLFLVLPKAAGNKTVSFKESFEIKKLFFVSDVSEYIHFYDFLKNKNDLNYTNCMLYHDFDKSTSTFINKVTFLSMIKKILNCNIIRFNKKCFKQKKGIPQGLSISSFLCNIYFYNLEKTLSHKICKIMTEKNLLMRFMDDYLLLTNKNQRIGSFINESFDIASQNAFNFNINKSQFNIDYKTGEKNNSKEFEWNGITFKLNNKNNFNMFIDSKDGYDLERFSTVININAPVNPNKEDYTWLIKKITSILLTGHPWIYFLSNLNDRETLLKNFEDLCKVCLFKLIILTRILNKYNLLPGQKVFNNIIMKCLKKFFFYINNKLTKAENQRFFIDDLQSFIEAFYKNIYNFYNADESSNLKRKSIYLFKCVRRKILSIK
jgi:hypothetical protein